MAPSHLPSCHLHCWPVLRLLFFLVVIQAALTPLSVTSSSPSVRSLSSSLLKPSKEVEELKVAEVVAAIVKQQFNATVNYTSKTNATVAGLFPSEVRIHFQGEPSIAALRDSHMVPDLSSLATLLTLNALVEATLKSSGDQAPTANLVQALDGLSTFRSPSFGENRSALMVFWPVQKAKGKKGKNVMQWRTHSENAVKGGGSLIPFTILNTTLSKCAKDKCPIASQGLQQISSDGLCLQYFNESLSDYAKRHNFPPDVTSSFANLALGALLQTGGSDRYSSAFEVWKNTNANMTRLVDHVLEFAYRPVTSNLSHNVIDSRMYYVIEGYLSQLSGVELARAAFVTNWLPQSSPEGRVKYGDQILPAYNTIDLFATSTFLYAVTTAVINKLIPFGNNTKTLIASNLGLMTWILANGRPDNLDLLMTSHPSRFQFYWMLSRTMFEMERARVQGLETYQLLEEFYTDWNTTVRNHVTEAILKSIKDGGLDGDGNALAYVDDILPPAAADAKQTDDKHNSHGSDRLFSTASATSALLSAWTLHDNKHQLLFLPDIPNDVALAARGLVNYVSSKCQSRDTSFMNVIHATQHKHCQSLPCYFASNSIVTQNGINFSGRRPTPEVLFGMRGHLTSQEYVAMLQQQSVCGQAKTARTLPGLDIPSAIFFFWSSPVYTQAMCLLAAAQMKNVQGQVTNMDQLMDFFRKPE